MSIDMDLNQMINQLKILVGDKIEVANNSNDSSSAKDEVRRGTRDSRCRWSKEEHEKFLDAVERFGRKNYKEITSHVHTRSVDQAVSHSQKMYTTMDKIFTTFFQDNIQFRKYESFVPQSDMIKCQQYAQSQFQVFEPFSKVEFDATIKYFTVTNYVLRVPFYCVFFQVTPYMVQQLYNALFKYAPRKEIVREYLFSKLQIDQKLIQLCLFL
ncbi:Myb-like_DNA-binding domain-containing protein [Hexamita inflata]|uniref:Myb-like_DNA-binding domain-containing protein n=1 Tax=Hexamita inflata TaxID=28002 RepID=A0ABP1ISY1_9EUKA